MDVAHCLRCNSICLSAGASYLCLWFEDGCSSNVCCQDLRTFASGVTLDVTALSALHLATFVGRSFAPLPRYSSLRLLWQQTRSFTSGFGLSGYCCAACAAAATFVGGSLVSLPLWLWFEDGCGCAVCACAMQLATCVGRSFVPLLWFEDGCCCAIRTAARSVVGRSFLPRPLVWRWMLRTVCAAARYVCRQELRTFASDLKMDVLATFVARTFVPLPLVWCWMLLRCVTIVGRSFVPLARVWRWMFLRCLRCSSLRLLAGASCLCLWFEDGCCCAVCAAARYVCWQALHAFASGLKMDGAALSALQLATFVGRSFVPLPLVYKQMLLHCLRYSSLRLPAGAFCTFKFAAVCVAAQSALQLATFIGRSFVPLPLVWGWLLRRWLRSSLRLSTGPSYLCLWLWLEDGWIWLRCLRCSLLRLFAVASYLCLWLWTEDGSCWAVCAAARYVCWQELGILSPLAMIWRWILLWCLHCISLRSLAGALYLCLWFEDGCCCAVCAAAHYVCWRELGTFAFGLKMDVSALSALQLATFVGRSFVPLPLVWRWMLLRCPRCSSLRLLTGASYLWKMDLASLFALQLATFVAGTFVPLPLVWRWMLLRCLRCSSLRLLAGALYLCIWFEDGCYCAVRAAAPYVCWHELCIFASGYDLKMNFAARFALQLATFVGRSFVPLPLVWRWMLLRCFAAAGYVCWQDLVPLPLVWRWMFLRCLRCSSLRLLAGASYLCLWFEDGCCCAVRAAARYVWPELRPFASRKMEVAVLSALQFTTFVGESFVRLSWFWRWMLLRWLRCGSLRLLAGASYLCPWFGCCCTVRDAARYVCWQELRPFASRQMEVAALFALQLAAFVGGSFVPLPVVWRWMWIGDCPSPAAMPAPAASRATLVYLNREVSIW